MIRNVNSEDRSYIEAEILTGKFKGNRVHVSLDKYPTKCELFMDGRKLTNIKKLEIVCQVGVTSKIRFETDDDTLC